MNKHFNLCRQLILITFGFYIVRPVEALVDASKSSYYNFKVVFLDTWNSENPYTPMWYYRECIKLWKEGK